MSTEQGRMILTSKTHYQLAAMTTLYTTVKLLETSKIECSLLAKLSKGSYSEKDIAMMELIILNSLGWRMIGLTPLAFLSEFVSFLPDSVQDVTSVKEKMIDVAQRQVELAISEYHFVTYDRSDIALAAVLNAMTEISAELFPLRSRKQFCSSLTRFCLGYKKNADIVDTQKRLNLLYLGLDCNGNDELIEAIGPNSDVRRGKLIGVTEAVETTLESNSISFQQSPTSTATEGIS